MLVCFFFINAALIFIEMSQCYLSWIIFPQKQDLPANSPFSLVTASSFIRSVNWSMILSLTAFEFIFLYVTSAAPLTVQSKISRFSRFTWALFEFKMCDRHLDWCQQRLLELYPRRCYYVWLQLLVARCYLLPLLLNCTAQFV